MRDSTRATISGLALGMAAFGIGIWVALPGDAQDHTPQPAVTLTPLASTPTPSHTPTPSADESPSPSPSVSGSAGQRASTPAPKPGHHGSPVRNPADTSA